MNYDSWLAEKVEEYNSLCTPKAIGIHQEPSDGEYSTILIYNCEECDDKNCIYWHDYNE